MNDSQSLTGKARFNYFLATEAIGFCPETDQTDYIFKLRILRKPFSQNHENSSYSVDPSSVDPSLSAGSLESAGGVASLFSSAAGSSGGFDLACFASASAKAALAAFCRFVSS